MSDNSKNNNSDLFVAPLTKIYRQKLKNKVKTPSQQTDQNTNTNKGSFVESTVSAKSSFMQTIEQQNSQSLKQGFIKKWVNIMRGFKKRYFVLTPELLIYYKQKKGQVSEKGQISLKLAKIDPRTMNDKRMIIGTGTGEIHLEFNTIQEKKEWLQAIDECKRKIHFANMHSSTGAANESEQFEFEEIKQSQSEQQQPVGGHGSSQMLCQSVRKNHLTNVAEEDDEEVLQTEGVLFDKLDIEVKNALGMALERNILKEDSQLSINLAETWAAQSVFEETLQKFRMQLQKQSDQAQTHELMQIGEKLEQSSVELKQSVTNAIKSIEQTKLQIIKILGYQDQKIQEQRSSNIGMKAAGQQVQQIDEKGYIGEEEKGFMSFSQDFNDMIEQKRPSKLKDQGRPSNNSNHKNNSSRPSSEFTHDQNPVISKSGQKNLVLDSFNDEDEDFYDAKGDEITLQHVQSEIQKTDEAQVQQINREEAEQEYRTMLPALKPPDQKVSVWKVIKDAVGKDLTRFCVPVYFNEPISMLQKVSEIMEYEQLLVKASEDKNQLKRLLYITAFGIAQYKCSDKRLNKPFNPILGETFELKRPNYLYFAEQVSHHPPISACYSFSDHYELWMNTNMKTQFWGKSLEIITVGYQNVRLKNTQEHFIIERPNSSVNNLIFGEMYIEHFGNMMVKNLKTGDVCNVEFKKKGWSGKGAYEIEGYALLGGKDKKYKIYGKWNEFLTIQNLGTSEEEQIWVANPMPPHFNSMYNFTYFTLQLNFLPPGQKEKLPPTDSRLRPDQRYLENGDLVRAANEKARLEDKQRKSRKEKEAKGIEHKAKYFEEYTDPESGEKGYRYVRDYWEDRKKGDWSHLEDIF